MSHHYSLADITSDAILRTCGGQIDYRAYDARARRERGTAFLSAITWLRETLVSALSGKPKQRRANAVPVTLTPCPS